MAQIAEIERRQAPGRSGLAEAVARGYHKLLAYKDEYEVARLFTEPGFREGARASSSKSRRKLEFHLAPPLLARRDKATGEPRKMRFGAWMLPVFRLLAKGKRPARHGLGRVRLYRRAQARAADDRRLRRLLDEIGQRLSPPTHATAVALASLPLDIKGFGHIKERNYKTAKAREAALLAELRNPRRRRSRRRSSSAAAPKIGSPHAGVAGRQPRAGAAADDAAVFEHIGAAREPQRDRHVLLHQKAR